MSLPSSDVPLLKPLSARSVHLCVDMQRIFSTGGLWEAPWMARVLPNVVRIVERHPERTILTRFMTPQTSDEAPGSWQAYYEKWPQATRSQLDPDWLRLVPELERHCPPALCLDKPTYSAFHGTELPMLLKERNAEALILTGSETDVCVLSTLLSAVDAGYFVTLVSDGVCSSSDEGHDNLLDLYSRRYSTQVQVMKTEEVVAVW